ncbi:hypothetical protein FOR85_04380 [Psychrobacter sp. YGAH215]|uniref:hypothetical protein n=1 Tax=Psychrobacter sp. YGAH215 TaxID=2596826 RepID=UPI001186917F|nr:hypothetical protein [Psychrobacter sp. YGAH215]TSB23720.1 hypothetical protein FOR85_04380 [Psychrobacter sp. YGAH215]
MDIVTLAPYATFAILLLALLNFLLNMKDRRNKQEIETRKNFLNHTAWTNEGDINSQDFNFITLRVHDISSYIFNGTIEYHTFEDDHIKNKNLVFYFRKSSGNSIYITVRETNGYQEFGEHKAKLKRINPELFHLNFKSSIFRRKANFDFQLPSELKIHPVDGYKVNDDSNSNHDKKLLTNDIINAISPERNYDKVKELLGIPDKTIEDHSVFEDDDIRKDDKQITSDLYFLKNAYLKVTTLDKVSIYSLTVFGYGSDISLPDIHYIGEISRNESSVAIVDEEMLNGARFASIRTMRDSAAAIQHRIGPPFYKCLTYFVHGYIDDDEDYNSLIGREIIGFCISDGDMSFYIYDYEMR